MDHLAQIARSAAPATAVQFRKSAYGKKGLHDFLRDVLAIANASLDGNRYIVIGVAIDRNGRRKLYPVDRNDFSGKPAYETLANEYIEPPLRIRYQAVTVDGERLGVFEIGDCQDRPYMMRVDHSELLRRGDAYMRIDNVPVKMGRRQLQTLFENKFRDAVSASNIEIGFPGDIIHKDLRIATHKLDKLPSAVASLKLTQLMEARTRVAGATTNSMLARLTHARLFGSDQPYESRSSAELLAEMQQIESQYHDQDNHFLFAQHRSDVQLVIYNQGEEAIRDASLTLVVPNHEAFYVATRLPLRPVDGGFVERTRGERSNYPSVAIRGKAIQVSAKLGDISPGAPVEAFEVPLRVCAGDSLEGRRFGVQYSLFAQNLRAPAKGMLRLLFCMQPLPA
ncbi:MAG: ATP-binding protein [Gammaproteobacteria bacterium]|nr:ATP-binding protein [Gammaproteobacteria bacterium]